MSQRHLGAFLDGASQPAMSSDIRGASQPAGDMQHAYHNLTLVSFNFGIQQSMMTSASWDTHADKLALLLNTIDDAVKPDFIFGCEMGGHQQGFSHAGFDFQNIVEQGLYSGAVSNTSGSYAAVWNI